MAEINKGYRHPGDVEIESTLLITENGQTVDLSAVIQEINVYQNMFEHYMQCDVLISDSMGILDALGGGFTGGEFFVLSFKNREETNESLPVRNVFRIYEVTDRQRVKESREIYTLSCISAEAYQSAPVKIKSALGGISGSTISSMVQSIFKKHINSPEIKAIHNDVKSVTQFSINKTNTFDETDGLQKFIIPHLTVDDTIEFLCEEADSEDHIPFYVFFENSDGFNFRSVGNLAESGPIGLYFYMFNNVSSDTIKDLSLDDAWKIISYNIQTQSDILTNLNSGLFKSRTINLDIHKKQTTVKNYSYEKYYPKFKKLEYNAITGGVGEDTDPVITLMTSRTGHDTDSAFAREKPLPKKINQVSDVRNAYTKSIFNTVLEIMLHGNSNYKAGDTIYLMFPLSTDMEKDKTGESYDKYLTGKYLITKVRHKITGGRTGDPFVSILECCKDGRAL